MTKTKSKTSEKRQNKGHHIDVRFTEEEYKQIVANTALGGIGYNLFIFFFREADIDVVSLVLPLF